MAADLQPHGPCMNSGDDPAHAKRPTGKADWTGVVEPYGGPRTPRCFSCFQELRRHRKKAAKEKRVERVYGISPEEYDTILASQGGRCAGCARSTGATKRLAVDHWHGHCATCATGNACRDGVRAILCGPCNQTIGRLGVESLLRLARVLLEHPAQKVLQNMRKDRL